jgi:gamma-glutamyl-gamma-aminobutyrate hydrolase PuuD
MSRTEELHKLAELFHAQAEATLNATAKQALHKMGDNYQREARQVTASLDGSVAAIDVLP